MSVIPFNKPRESRTSRPDEAESDAHWVDRALRGDRKAPEALYRRHARDVYDTLLRLFQNESDAQDALHDAFVVALEQLHQLKDPARFRPWVLRTAMRAFYRKSRRRQWLSRFVAQPHAMDAAPTASPDVQAEITRLFEVLQTVSPKARAAWSLRYVEGYTLAETALACDCSLATIKRRIASAQTVVRQHVQVEAFE